MTPRRYRPSLLTLSALYGAVGLLPLGCQLQPADPEGQAGSSGAAGAAGAAGSGGVAGSGGAAGSAGAAGSTGEGCGDVPTTGVCASVTTLKSCLDSGEIGQPPTVKEVTCPANTQCDDSGDYARCAPTGDCLDGASQCKDDTTLRTCVAGHWVESSCGASLCAGTTGRGAACISLEAGSGIVAKGVLRYQYRKPNDRTRPTQYSSTLSSEPAVNFLTAIYDLKEDGSGEQELIGPVVLTSVGDTSPAGSWEIELTRQPSPDAVVYFWPVAWSVRGEPQIAVVRAESSDASHQRAQDYWYWGWQLCTDTASCAQPVIDLADGTTILEADGSGAAHIFQWAIYDKFRFGGMTDLADTEPLSLAIFWKGGDGAQEPGIKFDCGNCFLPPQLGGAQVDVGQGDGQADHYDTSLAISGRGTLKPGQWDYESHWSRSTLNHELGHWAMQSWSRSPGEGGPHYVDEASSPGLAYSEAWATFSGQTNISDSPESNDPVYFTMQNGTGFWVNLASEAWSGGNLVKPGAGALLTDPINENVVASMMWSLWASAGAKSPQGLGDDAMFSVMAHPRLNVGPNRGYRTVDFVDYLDALVCGNFADAGKISDVVGPVRYPWSPTDVTCN